MIQLRDDLRKLFLFAVIYIANEEEKKDKAKKIVVGQSKWIFETKGKCVL